jgi:predicted Zn-dependent protease with MMP-like domain
VAELDELLDAIDAALDTADVAEALRLARQTVSEYPSEPEAHLALGDTLWDGGDLRGAQSAYESAARIAPDAPEVLTSLAWVHFGMADFAAARQVATRSLELEETAGACALLGRLAERSGLLAEADRLAKRAHRLDPDGFPLPCRFPDEDFRAAVAEALDRLPDEFRRALDGEVAVLVEPVPAVEVLTAVDPPFDPEILGLYVGTPLPERESLPATGKLPDVVYLFQRNLEHAAADRDELLEQIAITVYHEIGHYLGYDDDELEERGFG